MIKRQQVIALACALEAATGLGLLVAPALVVTLVLGSSVAGVAIVISNIAGAALFALAIACWPRAGATSRAPHAGMFVYNLFVSLVLGKIAIEGSTGGILLWPVVVTHLIFVVLIPLTLFGRGRPTGTPG